MAKKTTTNTNVSKKVYRFCGIYDNISIGTKIRLNGVKVILHEVEAININEAIELYKMHLICNVGISEINLNQYLIDLYYKSICVEVVGKKDVEIMTVEIDKFK